MEQGYCGVWYGMGDAWLDDGFGNLVSTKHLWSLFEAVKAE